MSLISKSSLAPVFELIPEGTHLARCYMMADIGLQQTSFGVKEQVVLYWEISEQKMDDGERA